jgi:hypothetical protein
MKEYCKKFSQEPDAEQSDDRQNECEPLLPQRPASEDLRFVVRESFNLGLRFISGIEQLLKKLEE